MTFKPRLINKPEELARAGSVLRPLGKSIRKLSGLQGSKGIYVANCVL